MTTPQPIPKPQLPDGEWITFPGGELEGTRPKALCPACREKLRSAVDASARRHRPAGAAPPLCFQCYRADLDRLRAIRAAGELNTSSEARFQAILPFEPVNRARLEMLRVERVAARAAVPPGAALYEDRCRRAQIEARHALRQVAAGLGGRSAADRERTMAAAVHAAELQLPESWLPFVVSR
jgi:hypothetical protein